MAWQKRIQEDWKQRNEIDNQTAVEEAYVQSARLTTLRNRGSKSGNIFCRLSNFIASITTLQKQHACEVPDQQNFILYIQV